MMGFIAVAFLTYVLTPNLDAVVPLVWYYAPHAYNLIIWPASVLVMLRPRFGPSKFLIAFVLVYGIDEILWNSIAFLHFGGGPTVTSYMDTQYWMVFFLAITMSVVLSYYSLKPKIVMNWTWIVFGAFVFAYAVLAGLPTYIDEPIAMYPYVYVWEIAWQFAVWLFIYGTFQEGKTPRANSRSPPPPMGRTYEG